MNISVKLVMIHQGDFSIVILNIKPLKQNILIYFLWKSCVCAKLLQSCLNLCDPMDYSLPGFSVCGILQARILDWEKKEYWSGLLCPPLGNFPDLGIKPVSLKSLHWQVGSLPLAPPGKPIRSAIIGLGTFLILCHLICHSNTVYWVIKKYLFIWLHQVLVVVCELQSTQVQ